MRALAFALLASAAAQQFTVVTLTHTQIVNDPLGGPKTIVNNEVITVPVAGQGGQGQGQNPQPQPSQTQQQPQPQPQPSTTQAEPQPTSQQPQPSSQGGGQGGGQQPPQSSQQPQPTNQPQPSNQQPGQATQPTQPSAQPSTPQSQAGSQSPGGTTPQQSQAPGGTGVVPAPVPGASGNATATPTTPGNGTTGTNGTAGTNGTTGTNGTSPQPTGPSNTSALPPVDGVPSGTPIAGNYSGPLRPQVHFTPPQGFMNDPNGLFRDNNGTWHLYYQYNPTAVTAGNQHWGHATSTNLTHWENQPIALFPPEKDVGVFSGSVVMDQNNTSGFFPNATNGIVAIYTLHYPNGTEAQAIATSNDTGYTFTPQGIVLNPNTTQFRDPKVIRVADKWVMAIARAQNATVEFYTSSDLKQWDLASNFTHGGVLSDTMQYECPNLVKVPLEGGGSTWLLLLSINPGGPLGGSTTQYFPGDFNGTHFTAADSGTRFLDWGKDAYAGQFFTTNSSGAGTEEPVLINWAGNWQYAQSTPTGSENWRGAMSLPRKVSLTNSSGWDLNQTPIFTPGNNISSSSSTNGSLALTSPLPSGAVYLSLNLTNLPNNATGTLNWTIRNSDELLQGGYFLNADLWLDRGGVKNVVDPLFNNKFSTNPKIQNGTLSLQVVYDKSIVEVFGAGVLTSVVYPAAPLTEVGVWADVPNGVGVDVGVWEVQGGVQSAVVNSNVKVDSGAERLVVGWAAVIFALLFVVL